MDNIKKNIFVKIIVFMVLQVSVVVMALSGLVIIANASNNWYSSTEENIHTSVMEDVADSFVQRVSSEAFTTIYEYEEDGVETYFDLIEKKTDLPHGMGYEISNYDEKEAKALELSGVALKKNINLKEDPAASSRVLSHIDDLKITVYLLDPEAVGWSASELYTSDFAYIYDMSMYVYKYKTLAIASGIASLVITVLLMAFLINSVEGRNKEKRKYKAFPTDIALLIAITIVGGCMAGLSGSLPEEYEAFLLLAILLGLVMSITVTGFIWFFAATVKWGTWWNGTVTYKLLKLLARVLKVICAAAKKAGIYCWCFVRKLPLVWKTGVALAIILFGNLIITINMYWYSEVAIAFWILGAVVIGVGVLYIALCMRRLQQGGEKLAAGDLEYQIDKKGLFLDLAKHADNLNSIGKGMAIAVEEKTKSERLKAELITNVSHDIKTPLTSIINYVDFLKKEELTNPKAVEYIEVLDRQANRLKKLTNDLVDASKASTGNIQIDLRPCQVDILLEQTLGEYKEKAEANDLKFVVNTPEEEVEILADGRRLWRVFDNLLNNICKYSQPGTRVYVDLKVDEDKLLIMYRNTSKYELNIPAEELTGRFVRGDSSRHTEGSGLGLSIARDLTELQGGTFDLFIDGDLFKVVMAFDLLKL